MIRKAPQQQIQRLNRLDYRPAVSGCLGVLLVDAWSPRLVDVVIRATHRQHVVVVPASRLTEIVKSEILLCLQTCELVCMRMNHLRFFFVCVYVCEYTRKQ